MRIIIDIVSSIINFIIGLVKTIVEQFFELNFFEKFIVINIIPAFFAIILPVARFFIFDEYYTTNNPFPVYLIGIVLLMIITIYVPSLIALGIRLFANGTFLIWVVYMHVSGELCKTPYELTAGYYLNIIVPGLFMVFSLLSFITGRE